VINSLKIKALFGFCLIHVGLTISLVALFRDDGAVFSGATFDLLLVGVCLMYGAYLFSVLSVWLELRPWIARIQRARNWRGWVLTELPTILALIPVVVAAIKVLRSSWSEIKDYQSKGELNLQNLASVAQKFAAEAETLAHAPAVEQAKKKLGET
jgi:hypothetical protein